jgi:hypothetical protein
VKFFRHTGFFGTQGWTLPNTVPKDLAGVGENGIEHEFSGAQRVDVSSFFGAYTVRALTSYIFV